VLSTGSIWNWKVGACVATSTDVSSFELKSKTSLVFCVGNFRIEVDVEVDDGPIHFVEHCTFDNCLSLCPWDVPMP